MVPVRGGWGPVPDHAIRAGAGQPGCGRPDRGHRGAVHCPWLTPPVPAGRSG